MSLQQYGYGCNLVHKIKWRQNERKYNNYPKLMERYKRDSTLGLNMATVNPCNNFIIDYLIRTKIKSDKQVSSKYYMYNLAIESVRKYPLPLICEQQLAALQGFGNFFINRVAKLMKKHYLRGRAPTEEEMEEDDRQHLEGIRQNLKRLNYLKKEKQQSEERQQFDYENMKKALSSDIKQESSQNEGGNIYQESQQSQSQSEKIRRREEKEKFERLMEEKEESESSSSSQKRLRQIIQNTIQKVKKKKNYKPRINTEPFQILKALIHLEKNGSGRTYAKKGEINEFLFNARKEKMKSWSSVRQRLEQFGYIELNSENDDEVQITAKGKDYVHELLQDENQHSQQSSEQSKRDISVSKSHSHSHSPNQSSDKIVDKKAAKIRKSNKQRGQSSKKSLSLSNYSKSSYTKSKQRRSSESRPQRVRYKYYHLLKKEKLSIGTDYEDPCIIVNYKSMINQRDQERISQFLNKMTQFQSRQDEIQLGQFAWCVKQNLLDILLFRIKIENFDLDQYFLLCQRARYSQCETVYFVFEESFNKSRIRQDRKQFMNTVWADTRIAGFKVFKTSGLGQTMCLISKITSDLISRVNKISQQGIVKPFHFLGSIKQFNQHIKYFKPGLVKSVAISCLKTLPNISRQMIKKIVRKMPGMWYIYKKLRQLRSNSQRKRFIYWYLQEYHPKKGMVRLLVDLMFFDSYEE